VVTLRHTHGYRFGQGDIYVTVKLIAQSEKLLIDPVEIAAAEWMSVEKIKSITENDPQAPLNGKISTNVYRQIELALEGPLIAADALSRTSGRKGSTLYFASSPPGS